MRCWVLSCLMLMTASNVWSQHEGMSHAMPEIKLYAGLTEKYHYAVSTKNTAAQKFFDQGMVLAYGFNHDMAIASFRHAAELDPNLAMAYWGIAWANGPNYNMDVDPDHEHAAYEAIQKAKSLIPEASPKEKDFIEAMAARYTKDTTADLKKLNVVYKEAMGRLTKKYPDDADAAVMYAESMMLLHPWQLWTADGRPNEGTEEIVRVLESVLLRDPDHVGAHHYYIHAVEASPHPEKGLASADKIPRLAEAAGHIVHMPAHIYMRVGDYEAAAGSNEAALDADKDFFKLTNQQGIYPLMYYNHNLQFLAAARAMNGQFADAYKAAAEMADNVTPVIQDMAMVEGFVALPIFIQVKFSRWDDILVRTAPASNMPITSAAYHFARALAFAAKGKTTEALKEKKEFELAQKAVPPDTPYLINSPARVLKVAEWMLGGKLAWAQKDWKPAIDYFQKMKAAEDSLAYDEPPAWLIPARDQLGRAYFAAGNFADAEKSFRENLIKFPKDGRSLFGLMESLKAQGKKKEAADVQKEFELSWKRSDVQLDMN